MNKKLLSIALVICMFVLNMNFVFASTPTEGQQPNWDDFFTNARLISYDESGVVLQQTKAVAKNARDNSESFVQVSAKFLPSDEENAQELIDLVQAEQMKRSQANYREISEQAGCGTLYSTVYFSIVFDSRGAQYYKIDTVSAGFRGDLTSGIRFEGNELLIGQGGQTMSGRVVNQTKRTSGDLTNVYVPSSWEPVFRHSSSTVGCSYKLTLRRGTGTWSTYLYNNL